MTVEEHILHACAPRLGRLYTELDALDPMVDVFTEELATVISEAALLLAELCGAFDPQDGGLDVFVHAAHPRTRNRLTLVRANAALAEAVRSLSAALECAAHHDALLTSRDDAHCARRERYSAQITGHVVRARRAFAEAAGALHQRTGAGPDRGRAAAMPFTTAALKPRRR